MQVTQVISEILVTAFQNPGPWHHTAMLPVLMRLRQEKLHLRTAWAAKEDLISKNPRCSLSSIEFLLQYIQTIISTCIQDKKNSIFCTFIFCSKLHVYFIL
jgi:hypothetical protein